MSHPTLAAAQDGRWSLRIERHYSHPISAVWSAITEPATLAQWFPFRVDWSPAVGAPITFTEHGPDITQAFRLSRHGSSDAVGTGAALCSR